jgi:hypothetical protein
MGAREDFMAVRRAANVPGVAALSALLRKAGTREVDFIRLKKAGIQAEVIDLAYAILGETRAEGPAVVPVPQGS